MLNIDKVLKAIADKQGKRKGDLKRSYNSIKKKKVEDNYDKVLPEENFKRLILLGVIKKLGMDIDDLDEIVEELDEPESVKKTREITEEELEEELDEAEDDDDDVIEFEEDDEDDEELGYDEFDSVEEVAAAYGIESSWEDIFDATADPEDSGDYERLESLLIMPGVEYLLKLVDPTELPYRHEGISDFPDKKTGIKKSYVTRAVDVKLIDLSPIRKFKEKYEKGDNRGNKCFVKGKKYKFWMSEAAFKWFKKFWVGLDRTAPDSRSWTYEKVKKTDITKHIYGEE